MADTGGLKNVDYIIDQFGGMRAMARTAGIPVSTIQGWKKRDHIPYDRVDEVLRAAKTNNIALSAKNTANQNIRVQASATTPEEKVIVMDNKTTPTPSADPIQTTAPSAVKPRIDTPTHTPSRPQYDLKKMRSEAVRRSVVTTLGIITVLGGTAWFLFKDEAKSVATLAQDQTQMQTRVSALSTQLNSFEAAVTDGLNGLSDRVTDVAAAVGVERGSDGQIILNNNMSLTERMTALESRLRAGGEEIDLGQILNRFETLNTSVEGQGQMDSALSDLKGIVMILQGRMGQLDSALEKAKQDNDALARSLENVSGRDLSAAAMLLALTQFRESMNREEPFTEDLTVLQELVGTEDPQLTAAINRLAPHAQNGVLTPKGLSEELRTITGDIIMAKLNGEDVSLQDRILARIGQILSIQKDGAPLIATDEQKIIAAAQKQLDSGDVEGALATLNQLKGDAATAAAPFKEKAQGTLAAQSTAALMMQKFIEKMNEPSGIQNMIKDLPAQIQGMTGGTVQQDPASGIVILE